MPKLQLTPEEVESRISYLQDLVDLEDCDDDPDALELAQLEAFREEVDGRE